MTGPQKLKDKKIMVVEDDKFLSDLVSQKLFSEGAIITSVGTGESALETLKSSPVHLVLLDLLLPGIGGFDVLEQMDKDEKPMDDRPEEEIVKEENEDIYSIKDFVV